MHTLKVYENPNKPRWATGESLPRDTQCARCPRGAFAGVHNCSGPLGDPGGVLLVFDQPPTTPEEVQYQGQTREIVASAWSGPIGIDYAVRCPVASDIDDVHVTACRPYTAGLAALLQPERVLLFGRAAAKVWVGDGMSEIDLDTAMGGWIMCGRLPVHVFTSPREVAWSRFATAFWAEAITEALSKPLHQLIDQDPYIRGAEAHLVECPTDTALALAELAKHNTFIVDLETYGRLGDDDCLIVCLGIKARGTDESWSWYGQHVTQPETFEMLRAFFANPNYRWINQNIKFDLGRLANHGLPITGGIVCTSVVFRYMRTNARKSNLASLSLLIGQGGFKHEQEALLLPVMATMRQAELVRLRSSGAKVKAAEVDIDEFRPYAHAYVDPIAESRYNAQDLFAADALSVELGKRRNKLPDRRAAAAKYEWKRFGHGLTLAFADMEANGVWMDKGKLAQAQVVATALAAKHQMIIGSLNVKSAPQVRAWLFNSPSDPKAPGLGLPPVKNMMTDAGEFSTDKTVKARLIATYHKQYPQLISLMANGRYRDLSSRYLKTMPSWIRQDGRAHSSFRVGDSAETGRPTSENPNLYNIPRAEDDPYDKDILAVRTAVKDIFSVPGAKPRDEVGPDDLVLVQVDASQIEIRIGAYLSGDPEMTAILASGEDYHMRTAELVHTNLGVTVEEWGRWVELAKDAKTRGDKDYKDPRKTVRSKVKAINFGLMYGKGDQSLADDLGITKEEAGVLRSSILGKFQRFAVWMAEQEACAFSEGGVWTYFEGEAVRFRHLWEAGVSPNGKFKSKLGEARRMAINTPIQASAWHYIAAAIIKVREWLRTSDFPAKMLLTVYDSIVFETKRRYADELSEKTKAVMCSFDTGAVPMAADADWGTHWGSMRDF